MILTMAVVFAASFGVSLLFTPLVRKTAIRFGELDVPNEERRVHRVPVPRLGGLAMYAAFAVGVMLTFVLDIGRVYGGNTNNRFEGSRVLLMLAGAGIIAAVMAWDDLRGIRPVPKLLWQGLAALVVVVPSLIVPGGPNFPETNT